MTILYNTETSKIINHNTPPTVDNPNGDYMVDGKIVLVELPLVQLTTLDKPSPDYDSSTHDIDYNLSNWDADLSTKTYAFTYVYRVLTQYELDVKDFKHMEYETLLEIQPVVLDSPVGEKFGLSYLLLGRPIEKTSTVWRVWVHGIDAGEDTITFNDLESQGLVTKINRPTL